MNFNDLSKFLNEESGKHTQNVYMPSIKRDIALKPLTTADVKTLSRIGVVNTFDINNELLKLALFDKLSIESKDSCGLDSASLTHVDFLSFLIGIRKLMSNELSFSFTCNKCKKTFNKTIDLETEFADNIYNYERKKATFEKLDNNGRLFSFDLESYTMEEYLYLRYYVESLKEIDSNNPDVLNEAAFIRPVIYIKNLKINNDEVTGWNEQTLAERIKIFNQLPSEILLDPQTNKKFDPESCLSNFIISTFDEEKLFKDVQNMPVKCPHCGEEYVGSLKLNDFFTF